MLEGEKRAEIFQRNTWDLVHRQFTNIELENTFSLGKTVFDCHRNTRYWFEKIFFYVTAYWIWKTISLTITNRWKRGEENERGSESLVKRLRKWPNITDTDVEIMYGSNESMQISLPTYVRLLRYVIL